MLCPELFEVRSSPIEGKGLFAKEFFRAGSILILFFRGRFMTSDAYGRRRAHEQGVLAHSAIHYVGDVVLYNEETHYEDYINHSDAPNVLYHCGIGFAQRDILPDEELTVDYRLWLPHEDAFVDKGSKLVSGRSPRNMLLESTHQLLELLYHCPQSPSLPSMKMKK